MRTTTGMGADGRCRLAALLLTLAMAVAACGGGGGGEAGGGTPAPGGGTPAPGGGATATIGRAGGTVDGPDATQVVVPAEALASEATVRVAIDSSGAPALPIDLPALGNTYAITPHGAQFERPVTVRLPLPPVTLEAHQRLALAKAQPGGSWEVLLDTIVEDGRLVAQVSSFSYFAVVVVNYPVGQGVVIPPLAVTSATLSCGDEPCNAAVGAVSYTYAVVANGGAMPSECRAGRLEVGHTRNPYMFDASDVAITPLAPTGGSVSGTVYAVGRDRHYFGVRLKCADRSYRMSGSALIFWVAGPAYPALAVLRSPARVDVVEGQRAEIEAILAGGALGWSEAAQRDVVPTSADRAVIDWQRSDDQGASWTTVAQSFQDEANPRPEGTVTEWKYWSVRHSFMASAADHGALVRVRACYTPPDVPAPPCVTGPSAQLNVVQQSAVPRITGLPRPVLVRTGQTASFSAVATGTPAPVMQWQTRAANGSGAWSDVASGTGASTANFTTPVLDLSDNGRQYRIVATNAVGQAESPAVTVSVSDQDVGPMITAQPATLAVPAGGDAVFAVDARGTEALSYQWRFNGAPLVGANGAVLRLPAVTAEQAGRYSVVVSNVAGSATSDNATLDVTAGAPAAIAPSVVTQPAAVTVNEGNTATFAVGVGGTAPFSYQWLKDGQPIEGATAAFYSLPAATSGAAGGYSVRVSNAAGNVTSATATLTVNAAAAPVPVSISTQPSPQVQLPGGSATFAVAASGSGPIAYQWLKNGAPIAAATGAVLVLPGVTGSDAASYAVTVSNSLGSVTSNGAALTVVGAPAITTQPAGQSVVEGSTATFSVAATGSALGYQWTRDGVAIPGATAASYTTPALTLADGGSGYGVVVYNGAGVVVSNPALLLVSAAPSATPAQARGKIAAAYLHTCAITAANAVACWGHNTSGQIGTGSVQARSTPYVWSLPEAAVSVSAGANGSCAVTASGSVWCSGSPLNTLVPTQLAGWTGVRQVAVGQMHTCLLASDATAWCWGANGGGQLGNGGTSPSATPVQVQVEGGAAMTGVQALQAGLTHTCAVLGDYSTRCWGTNTSAQSGAAAGVATLQATSVAGAVYVDQLALGGRFSCAYIGEGGQVRCWGLALDGSGNTSPVATSVFDLNPVAVGAGEAMACAITNAGAVHCWGTGMMGNGNVNQDQWAPTAVSGLTGALAMAGGQGHSCVLRNGGSLQCWGSNSDYQLGLGDSVPRTTPAEVSVAGGFWRP